MVCHFCKNNGHTIQQCPIRAEVTCFRCNGKGHYQSHCPVSQKDVDFPPLGSGSTPRHTGSTPHIPGSRTRHSGSTPHIPGSTPPVAKSSSYEDAVKRFADNFILTIKRMCNLKDKWFVIYPKDRIIEDPFLQKVHDIILSEVQAAELDYEAAQYVLELAAEKRDMEIEAKAKQNLAELFASMSPEELEEFENRSSDEDSEEESYYCEGMFDVNDDLETQKKKVEELLNQMEQKQVQRSFEIYEQRRILQSSNKRPRYTLWSAIKEKMY